MTTTTARLCLLAAGCALSTGFTCYDPGKRDSAVATELASASDTPIELALAHRGNAPIEISIAWLRPDVDIDCDASMAARPYLARSAFGPPRTIALQRSVEHGVAIPDRAGCRVFRMTERASNNTAIGILRPGANERVELYDDGRFVFTSGSGWMLPTMTAQRGTADCPPVETLDWTVPVPVGDPLRIDSLERDGPCTKMEVTGTAGGRFPWRVCTGGSLPLEIGDRISIATATTTSGPQVASESLTIERSLPSSTSSITLSRETVGNSRMLASAPSTYLRGAYRSNPPSCAVHDPCRQSWLPATLQVQFGSNQLYLGRGDHARIGDTPTGSSLEVRVLQARARFAAPRGCFGPDDRASELQFVSILSRPREPSSTPRVRAAAP